MTHHHDGASHGLPSLAVVIPTRDRAERLARVLSPLLEDAAVTEVVVVVDGSDDGSAQVLDRMAADDSRVRPIVLPDAVGRATARAFGLAAVSSDVVLMLDDDVLAAPGLASGHRRRLADRRDRVVVGYMPIPRELTERSAASQLYSTEYESACADYARDPGGILLHLWGGNVSAHREDLQRSGCLEREFGGKRHVDRHLGLCCHAAGMTAVFDRTLLATHEHERDLAAFARDAYEQGGGRIWLHAAHGDVLGDFAIDRLSAELPPGAGGLVRVARRPRGHAVIAGVLMAAARTAAAARLRAVELRCMRMLRRIEQQRGAIDEARAAARHARARAISRS